MTDSDDSLDDGEIHDELPADLDLTGFVGTYQFPDNSRRRWPGTLYLAVAAILFISWLNFADDGVLVNDGYLWCAIGLAVFGVINWIMAWKVAVKETDALEIAGRHVGFAAGHSSAQMVWRGWLSKPTWRVLVYSTEEPPAARALVLIDGVGGDVLQDLIQDNPQD
ncbi:MAG: hypothetical protein GY745_17070 [Actinomycetia bacterium]|nr:hypothetical protein [Actinomycetes bacterium]MCP4086744.1 hypothetical protein [Actinomycetes bacterium]